MTTETARIRVAPFSLNQLRTPLSSISSKEGILQSEVTRILDGKRIQYQLVDISQDNALRDEMRALAGNPKATPPQIVNGDQYCGDYELFVEAVEQNTLQEFLKLHPAKASKQQTSALWGGIEQNPASSIYHS
uniref:SH3 domain-binding glutamic acid-rich-like protein 3 n=1 Tax=Canis lupus dingo TaxID=286419 RepID=A0A8C0LEC8_CANLU